MPPKRKSTGSSGPAKKKAKSAAPSTEPASEPPRSKRWSAVSASANAEADYRKVWQDEETAYAYITLCLAYHLRLDDEDDDDSDHDSDADFGNGDKSDEDEDEEEGEEEEEEGDDSAIRLGPRCQKKRCHCFKPFDSNPKHPWVISWAGHSKFVTQFLHVFLREPDNFAMCTFNDHVVYGSMEVLENLFLDFEDARKEQRGEWREQWAVCECAVHWLSYCAGQFFALIDDSDRVHEVARLVGRMFLAMLAQLDELDLVGDATAVQSLGCTMAMYMALASSQRAEDIIQDDDRENYTSKLKFQPDYYEDAVLTYANKRGVTLRGPADIEELMAQAVGDVELPGKDDKDPWGWKAALKKYVKNYGSSHFYRGAPKIGSDDYNVTTWPPAQRKAASFTEKDPFGKQDIDAIKNGHVIELV